MKSKSKVSLNMQIPNFSVVVYAVQGDVMSREVTAALYDGQTAFEPPYGTLGTVRFLKPDGTSGFYDTLEDEETTAVTWDGNIATIRFAEQVLTVPGDVIIQVSFYSPDAERLSSFNFKLVVEKNPFSDEEFESTDYYSILTQQIASILDVVTNMPAPATVLPQMDGTAAIGLLGEFARSDHVHPATPLEHIEEVDVVNLNTLTQAGWYHGETDGTVTLNGVDAFYCLVLNDDSYVKQFIIGEYNYGNTMWMRYYNGSAWTNKRIDFADTGIESGTGYIKYPDGTLINYGQVAMGSKTSAQTGNLYTAVWHDPITFPQAFKDGNYSFTATPLGASYGFVIYVSGLSTTGVGSIEMARPNSGNILGTISYVAIGKWK